MSKEGLERDNITVNTTTYCLIPSQLYIQKIIYEPMTTMYRVSLKKKPPLIKYHRRKQLFLFQKIVNSKITEILLNRAAVSFG